MKYYVQTVIGIFTTKKKNKFNKWWMLKVKTEGCESSCSGIDTHLSPKIASWVKKRMAEH